MRMSAGRKSFEKVEDLDMCNPSNQSRIVRATGGLAHLLIVHLRIRDKHRVRIIPVHFNYRLLFRSTLYRINRTREQPFFWLLRAGKGDVGTMNRFDLFPELKSAWPSLQSHTARH